MPPSKSLLRTMSPKRSRTLAPEDEDGSSLERKGSLRVRSNSLRGGLRLKHKTHGAPVSEDDESFKREWGMSREAEVCTPMSLMLELGQCQGTQATAHIRSACCRTSSSNSSGSSSTRPASSVQTQVCLQCCQCSGRLQSPRVVPHACCAALVPDWYFLRRFLRARQHDLKRAKDMYAASMKWRAEFGTDTILEDFHFHERDAFISLYPQGYHKTDKVVRAAAGSSCTLPKRRRVPHLCAGLHRS